MSALDVQQINVRTLCNTHPQDIITTPLSQLESKPVGTSGLNNDGSGNLEINWIWLHLCLLFLRKTLTIRTLLGSELGPPSQVCSQVPGDLGWSLWPFPHPIIISPDELSMWKWLNYILLLRVLCGLWAKCKWNSSHRIIQLAGRDGWGRRCYRIQEAKGSDTRVKERLSREQQRGQEWGGEGERQRGRHMKKRKGRDGACVWIYFYTLPVGGQHCVGSLFPLEKWDNQVTLCWGLDDTGRQTGSDTAKICGPVGAMVWWRTQKFGT